MNLELLIVSHRQLRNPAQIPALMQAIIDGELLPEVTLFENVEGEIQILDGHHRCIAYYLAGFDSLGYGEYILLPEIDQHRPNKGTLREMVLREGFEKLFG